MHDIAPVRVRIDLTPPQAVPQTSGLLFEPAQHRGLAAVTLAPGAGTDLMHPVLLAVGKGLADAGHPALLFNFAFTEAGRKRPDPTARLERAYVDVLGWLRERYGPHRAVLMGGRSLGGRIASRIAADGVDCAGLVLLGYPLHPRRRRDADAVEKPQLRTDHWSQLAMPVLFVQGDRDALCNLDILEQERANHLAHVDSQVHIVRGGDHTFGVRARDMRTSAEVLQEVSDTVVTWVREHEPAPTA